MVAKGDPAGAFALLAKHAKAGHVEAQYRVGRCYLDATGVPPSAAEATVWLNRAAEAGHVEAQARLAALFMQGLAPGGVNDSRSSSLFQMNATGPDFNKALIWARKAAEAGQADGQSAAGDDPILRPGGFARRGGGGAVVSPGSGGGERPGRPGAGPDPDARRTG